MKKLIFDNRYLLLCIVANVMFLRITYLDCGRVTITFLHFFVGIVPLIFQIVKAYKRAMLPNEYN
jgi:hypothetical protein